MSATKKIIDLNFYLKDVYGVLMPDHAGKILAQVMVGQTKGDALKYWEWAINLSNKKQLELDESDYDNIKQFVKDSENLSILAKAQILKSLKD